jgi:hypothetical protein
MFTVKVRSDVQSRDLINDQQWTVIDTMYPSSHPASERELLAKAGDSARRNQLHSIRGLSGVNARSGRRSILTQNVATVRVGLDVRAVTRGPSRRARFFISFNKILPFLPLFGGEPRPRSTTLTPTRSCIGWKAKSVATSHTTYTIMHPSCHEVIFMLNASGCKHRNGFFILISWRYKLHLAPAIMQYPNDTAGKPEKRRS